MYCPQCGSPNADGASFCSKCGAALTPSPASGPTTAPSTPSAPAPLAKDPVVAAILNFFFGIGYIYLGYQKVVGLPAIVFVIVVLVVDALVGFFSFGLGALVVGLLLAYDGYQKAKGLKGYVEAS